MWRRLIQLFRGLSPISSQVSLNFVGMVVGVLFGHGSPILLAASFVDEGMSSSRKSNWARNFGGCQNLEVSGGV